VDDYEGLRAVAEFAGGAVLQLPRSAAQAMCALASTG